MQKITFFDDGNWKGSRNVSRNEDIILTVLLFLIILMEWLAQKNIFKNGTL